MEIGIELETGLKIRLEIASQSNWIKFKMQTGLGLDWNTILLDSKQLGNLSIQIANNNIGNPFGLQI